MLLERFIRLQIWKSDGTSIEYDNKIDDYWGITENSITLNKVICPTELSFGDINSSMLELQIFGLDVDLNRRKIRLIAEDKVQEDTYLATEDDDPIVTENGEYLHGGFAYVDVNTTLFTGYVDVTQTDYERTYRDIVAYDWFYFHKDDNVWEWFIAWWSDYFQQQACYPRISEFIPVFYSMLNDEYDMVHHNIGTISTTDLEITFPSTGTPLTENCITISQLFKYIYEIECCFVYINGSGDIEIIQPHAPSLSLGGEPQDFTTLSYTDYEHENSTFENYDTLQVNHFRASIEGALKLDSWIPLSYDTAWRFYHNYLDSVDNVFLNGHTSSQLQTIAQFLSGILQAHSSIEREDEEQQVVNTETCASVYAPCEIHMITSDLTTQLGKFLEIEILRRNSTKIERKYALVMEIEYSGSLLVNQTIKCNAQGKTLTSKIS